MERLFIQLCIKLNFKKLTLMTGFVDLGHIFIISTAHIFNPKSNRFDFKAYNQRWSLCDQVIAGLWLSKHRRPSKEWTSAPDWLQFLPHTARRSSDPDPPGAVWRPRPAGCCWSPDTDRWCRRAEPPAASPDWCLTEPPQCTSGLVWVCGSQTHIITAQTSAMRPVEGRGLTHLTEYGASSLKQLPHEPSQSPVTELNTWIRLFPLSATHTWTHRNTRGGIQNVSQLHSQPTWLL